MKLIRSSHPSENVTFEMNEDGDQIPLIGSFESSVAAWIYINKSNLELLIPGLAKVAAKLKKNSSLGKKERRREDQEIHFFAGKKNETRLPSELEI